MGTALDSTTPVLETFENEDLKKLTLKMIATIPDYWYHVPASSTGKYHPEYSLGEGGLLRHTIAVCRFLNYLFDATPNDFTSRERDLLRIAAIMHDSRKSGTQENYNTNKYTNFNHPIQAANVVRSFKGKYDLNDDELELIASAISKHMGKWNVDNKTGEILPTPDDKYSKILHCADYLASRKDILMTFENTDNKALSPHLPDIAEWTIPFGKYQGKTIPQVIRLDKQYIAWAKVNIEKEPFKSLLATVEV